MNLIPLGLLASLAAGLATGLGAIPVLFTKLAQERLLDAMLGFVESCLSSSLHIGKSTTDTSRTIHTNLYQ